ncbi:MAG: hypothetical protein OXC72_15790 [Roseovarius sp.]|nr:hypothetical protein [Roseovarius sp.]
MTNATMPFSDQVSTLATLHENTIREAGQIKPRRLSSGFKMQRRERMAPAFMDLLDQIRIIRS